LYHDNGRARWPRFAHLLVAIALAGASACAGQNGLTPSSPGTNETAAAPSSARDFLGCKYPSGDVYQTDISGAKLDSNSNAYISAVLAARGGSSGFIALVNTQTFNKATNKTPLLPVEPENTWDHPYSPVPWAADFKIEKDGDHHSEVIESKTCQYYEGYVTEYDPSSNSLAMYNNTHVDLTKPFVRPATGALSTATGIPLGLLAVRPEELAAGVIHHAIGWNIVSGTGNGASNGPCVSPAGKVRCTDGNTYDGPKSDTPMPYGSHARLKASFDTSGFSREAKIVAQAMQKYGLYVYDSGCCNVIVLADDGHGQPVWTSEDVDNLQSITPADFEIVAPPSGGS
jgi:hypothetical protein